MVLASLYEPSGQYLSMKAINYNRLELISTTGQHAPKSVLS